MIDLRPTALINAASNRMRWLCERSILLGAQLSGIDLLTLAYRNIGILNHGDFSVTGESFFVHGVLRSYVKKPHATFFDVGANIGAYSKELRHAFPDVHIYAFEPNAKTYDTLVLNTYGLDIDCSRLGFSRQSGKKKLYTYVSEETSQLASVYRDILLDLWTDKPPELLEIEFDSITIDDFCNEREIDFIDFLKIDTEGHELAVLMGAKKMLAKNRIGIIQFEFNETNIVSRVFLKDFYDLLPQFEIYRLGRRELIPLSKYSTVNEIFKLQNLLAINTIRI